MVNEFCGFRHGVIGTDKMPADTTLNNMKKADLIKLLHTAQQNYESLMWFYNNAVKANMSQLNNNGWIACSERLPEEKEHPITHDYMQYPVMVNIGGTVDTRYYYFGNGHWRWGFEVMDKYVTHWMDIAPYQPKGE